MVAPEHERCDHAGHAACSCGQASATPLTPSLRDRWWQGHTSTTITPYANTTAGLSGKEACAAIGITYRQLDYWARTDLLTPSITPAAGSGTRRRYSPTDIELGRIIAHFARAGALESARAAVEDLRRIVTDPNRPTGIYITVDHHQLTLDPPVEAARRSRLVATAHHRRVTTPPPLTDEQWQRALDHRGFVAWVVHRRWLPPHRIDDALQDGFLGLCQAIRLDNGPPEAFLSYAHKQIAQAITRGIGQAEGIGFRQARYDGRRHDWPLSLDAPAASDGRPPGLDDPSTIGDSLIDAHDLEQQVLSSIERDRIEALLLEVSTDSLDLDIGCSLLALDGTPIKDQNELLAAAHNTTPRHIATRRHRLRVRLTQLLDAA